MANQPMLRQTAINIVDRFKQLVTVNPQVALRFVQAVPNANALFHIAQRLCSASRYLDAPLPDYDAPDGMGCSPSAESNSAYSDDPMQLFYHPDPMCIRPGAHGTFPPSVEMAWKSVHDYVKTLDDEKRYYEPEIQWRYLRVEADVE